MTPRRVLGVLACALGASWIACGSPEARGQWLITVRTDAPIPLVGDRLMVEITDDDGQLACTDCRRFVDVHAPTVFPVSFGIVPPATAAPLRVRARLHRARSLGPAGLPPPSTTIDAVARLPAAAPSVPTHLALELRMSCFGIASDRDHACDPSTGALADLGAIAGGDGDPTVNPGSWPDAATAPCDGAAAPPGMRCGPTGLFFLGNPLDVGDPTERLARVDAYYIDQDEFSVGRARTLIRSGKVSSEPVLHGDNPFDATFYCPWRGAQDGTHDGEPLACVNRALATRLCEAEGKTLPTEAQFAAAAVNGALATRFPWGDGDDVCAHAVVARGEASLGFPASCRSGVTTPVGPEPLDTPTLDVTVAPAGIRRLGGNLSEWVLDDYARFSAPCWSSPPVLVNPRCVTGGVEATIRGGMWDGPLGFARSSMRSSSSAGPTANVGFRCVKRAG